MINTKEKERKDLLKEEEDTWCQKRRAIWLKSGDRNTKFFHHFTNDRQNRKQIWDLHLVSRLKITGQQDLKEGAVEYFK